MLLACNSTSRPHSVPCSSDRQASVACRAVCDEQWHNATGSLSLRGAISLEHQAALQKPPTWCKLRPDTYETLAQRSHPHFPENVFLTHSIAATQADQ